MEKARKLRYRLSVWMQLTLALFFLMLAAILVILIVISAKAITVRAEVETMLSPSSLSKMASKVISASSLKGVLLEALQDPELQKHIQGDIVKALKDPDIQRLLQEALIGAMFPAPNTHKRDATTCRGITDAGVCARISGACGNLADCARTRNITVCQAFGRDAIQMCTSL